MKLTEKVLIIILVLSLLTLGCDLYDSVEPEEALGKSIYEARNLSYGDHAEQKMDVYLPKTSEPSPVMFIVHGGGWHWGNKSDIDYYEQFRSKGFAVVNINYRLGDISYTLKEKIDDIQSAIDFMYKYKEQWNISDDLSLRGSSAGAHMVLLYGFNQGLNHIDRIISYSGPTDLTNPFYESNGLFKSIKALFNSKNPSEEDLKKASPIYTIPDQVGPPVIFIHGNSDRTVDFNDSKRLYTKLINAGWNSCLIELPNVDHDFEGTDWEKVDSIYTPWIDKQVWPSN